jgi:hypothetical protein
MSDGKRALAVISAGVLVRLVFWLTTPVTGDACFHYSISKYIAETLSIPTFECETASNPFWWPPLFHATTAVVYRLTSFLTLTPLLFGVLGLTAFYFFCKRFYPETALTATLILAFLPFHMYYSSIGYFETLLFLLAVTAFHYYLRFLQEGGTRNLAYSAAASGLSALTHYHGLVPLLAVSAHLFLRDRRKAVVVLVAGLLIASPWYARNFIVFGNPVWPKIYSGRYPDDADFQKIPLGTAVSRMASPGRWMGVFFDFWIGAPNSGEDFWKNVEVGESRYPFFIHVMVFWLVAILLFSLLALKGFLLMKEEGAVFFPLLVFAISLAPFIVNSLARMFVAFIPFTAIAMAKGLDVFKPGGRHIILAVAFLLFVGGSYSYAYTYKRIREDYNPFFDEIKSRTPADARIIMPFPSTTPDCVYYTERCCPRIGRTGGIPDINAGNIESIISEYDIDYVCCSTLHWDINPERYKRICEHFKNVKPFIDYTRGDVWGRCWDAGKSNTAS